MRGAIGAALAFVVAAGGCTGSVRSPQGEAEDVAIRASTEPTPPPSYFVHVVEFRGETLGQITEWYTGRYDNWRAVARANDLAVPNEALKVGRQVRIPSQLVVRQDPLPAPKRKRATKAAAPTAPVSAAPGEPSEGNDREEPALPQVIGPK